AEDGIRDKLVTGVQTCALPIFGKANWNPLATLIEPGETVLLKPNLVKEKHPRDPQGWKYVLTHGSVIRAVADYAWKALRGHGTRSEERRGRERGWGAGVAR